MKPYLVDVPVLVHVWCRPQVQKRTFEPIRQARPSILFLSSDGGRNEEEWEKIRESRKIVEEGIDWDCTVYKLYQTENQGMYTMGSLLLKFVFEHVDRVVEMEDDILADPSFFRFCAELLERYKDDQRVLSISGENRLGIYEESTADYMFGYGYTTWGFAYWKRSYALEGDTAWMKDPHIFQVLKKILTPGRMRDVESVRDTGNCSNAHKPGTEFYWGIAPRLLNQMTIYPKYNLCTSIGATDDAAHSVDIKKLDKWNRAKFERKVYACPEPITHMDYVMEDLLFKERCVKNAGSPVRNYLGLWITRFKRLRYGDGKVLWNAFVQKHIKHTRWEN